MLLTTLRSPARRNAFTLMEVLIVVAIIVILAGSAIIAVPAVLDQVKKSRAQTMAVNLEKMCNTYKLNPANGDQWPTAGDLLTPPNGGPSLLQNGQQDLLSPWGQQFNFEVRNKPDGTEYMYVYTIAPDGTYISNFGQGVNAEPHW